MRIGWRRMRPPSTSATSVPRGAEDHRARRDLDRAGAGRQVEAHLRIAARMQFALRIVGDQLHLERAGLAVDRVGTADHLGLEAAAGIIGGGQRRLQPRRHRRRIDLRHADIEPDAVDVGDAEQRLLLAGTRADEIADIDGAGGDHAGEGRADRRILLQRQQPAEVGGRGLDGGGVRGGGTVLFVGFLARHRIGGQQIVPARRRAAGERSVGARADQIGARLRDLLVEIGGIDPAERRPGRDLRADVAIPGADIAADAGVEPRRVPGRHRTGQGLLVDRVGAGDRHQPHDRQASRFRPMPGLLRLARPGQGADRDDADRDDRRDDPRGLQPLRGPGRRMGGVIRHKQCLRGGRRRGAARAPGHACDGRS